MNRILLTIALLVSLLAGSSWGQGSGFGVGAIVGDPTGISLKKWISEARAIDGAVAWSLDDEEELQLHADYLFHYGDLLRNDPKSSTSGTMPVYYGIGAVVKFIDDDDNQGQGNGDDEDEFAGVRLPVGLNYVMKNHPLDFFAELVPVLQLIDETDFELDAGLGVRYWFR